MWTHGRQAQAGRAGRGWLRRGPAGRPGVWMVRRAAGLGLLALSLAGSGAVLRQTRGVVIPVYAPGRPQAVGSIRIDRVFRDHRRMGFFRVKALPVVVAQGVGLEVREPAGAPHLLDELAAALKLVSGGRAFEAREVRLTMRGEPGPRLQARRLCPAPEAGRGAFVLEGVCFPTEGRRVEWPTATARPAGPGVLRLSGRRVGVVDLDLASGQFTFNPIKPSVLSP